MRAERGAIRNSDVTLDDTRKLPRVSATAPLVEQPAAVPLALAGMLLPNEHITFASRPHRIVLFLPAITLAALAIALAIALSVRLHPVVHGHHVEVPWLDARTRVLALTIGGIALLSSFVKVASAAAYYFGFRIVTTNRRAFLIEGLLARRIRPLGNTAMAGSTLLQGPLGRLFGFGSITTGKEIIRDMRDAVRLYREFGAVANGVDGNTWTPAVRQTQVP